MYNSVYLLPEVSVPVSMKEVGGYIEKQVAYLSGEDFLLISFTKNRSGHSVILGLLKKGIAHLVFPRGPWGRLQCHHHPPRVLGFQWHPGGSFSQSLLVPHSHPSVCAASFLPASLSLSALHQTLVFWAQLDPHCSSADCQMSPWCPLGPNLSRALKSYSHTY